MTDFFGVKGFSIAGRFLRSHYRRICLEATTVEIETLTPRLVGLEQVRPALDAV